MWSAAVAKLWPFVWIKQVPIKATAYPFRAHGTLERRGIAQFGLVRRAIRKSPECAKADFAVQQLRLSGCRLWLCT